MLRALRKMASKEYCILAEYSKGLLNKGTIIYGIYLRDHIEDGSLPGVVPKDVDFGKTIESRTEMEKYLRDVRRKYIRKELAKLRLKMYNHKLKKL